MDPVVWYSLDENDSSGTAERNLAQAVPLPFPLKEYLFKQLNY